MYSWADLREMVLPLNSTVSKDSKASERRMSRMRRETFEDSTSLKLQAKYLSDLPIRGLLYSALANSKAPSVPIVESDIFSLSSFSALSTNSTSLSMAACLIQLSCM